MTTLATTIESGIEFNIVYDGEYRLESKFDQTPLDYRNVPGNGNIKPHVKIWLYDAPYGLIDEIGDEAHDIIESVIEHFEDTVPFGKLGRASINRH